MIHVFVNNDLREYNDLKEEIMLLHCLKCQRKTPESRNPRAAKTNKEKPMLLSKCVRCDSKKSRFIEKQEASGFLNNLGLKTA